MAYCCKHGPTRKISARWDPLLVKDWRRCSWLNLLHLTIDSWSTKSGPRTQVSSRIRYWSRSVQSICLCKGDIPVAESVVSHQRSQNNPLDLGKEGSSGNINVRSMFHIKIISGTDEVNKHPPALAKWTSLVWKENLILSSDPIYYLVQFWPI